MIRRGKRFLKIAAVLFALLLLLAAIVFLFPQTVLCVDSGPTKADAIIVLGGGGSHERPERAAELFFLGDAPRILVSGSGDDWINRRILISDGVPARDIELEGNSLTTRQNAQFSAQMLRRENCRTVIIVTSWYHSRRALKTFEHFAPDLKFYSRPSYYGLHHFRWGGEFSRHVYYEFLKLPMYWICYHVCPF